MAETKRPLIDATIRTEFGDFIADQVETGDGRGIDLTETPGFSDLRRQRDIALAEVHAGKRSRDDVPSLPVNVRLVRRTKASGDPDGTKVVQSKNLGYRPVTKEDVGQPWFKEMPAGTTILPDGTLAKGDCVYHVTDARTAGRNEARKFKQMVEMANLQFDKSADVRESDGNLGASLGAVGGTIKKLDAGASKLTKKDVMAD
jgi:hypothetical protein